MQLKELCPSVRRLSPLTNDERYEAMYLGLMVLDGQIRLNTMSCYRIYDYAYDVKKKLRSNKAYNEKLRLKRRAAKAEKEEK